MQDEQVNLTVLISPGDQTTYSTYTVSVGKRILCVDANRDDALEMIGDYLDGLEINKP